MEKRIGIWDFELETRLRANGRDRIDTEWLERRDSGELVWIDKSGTAHPLKDMTDDYVANAFRYLKKSIQTRTFRRSGGYDPVRAELKSLEDDWGEDNDVNWIPQEFLGGPFDGLF